MIVETYGTESEKTESEKGLLLNFDFADAVELL